MMAICSHIRTHNVDSASEAQPRAPSRQNMLMWYHLIACESHRQMLATALGVLSGEIDDLRTDETRQLADETMPWSRGIAPA